MTDDLLSIVAAPQLKWTRRAGRGKSCGRDPQAGPGSCAAWWEGCPDAERRNCILLWQRRVAEHAKAAHGIDRFDLTGTSAQCVLNTPEFAELEAQLASERGVGDE